MSMKHIVSLLKQFTGTRTVIAIFFLLNLFFNFRLWGYIFFYSKDSLIPISDAISAGFVAETIYQNIITGKHIFAETIQIFYPFGANLTLIDPAALKVIFFFIFRPFLSLIQTMHLIAVLNIFISNCIMYALLRKMKLSRIASFFGGLVFGFTPIISYRINGHYTYTPIYIWPLLYYAVLSFFTAQKNKMWWSIGIGVIGAMSLFSNFYYFITTLMGGAVYAAIHFVFYRRSRSEIWKNSIYILISALVAAIVLLPWFLQVKQYVLFQNYITDGTIGQSLTLSSDLLNFITPGEYNPIYHFVITHLHLISGKFASYEYFYIHNWPRFSYPGVLILLSFVWLSVRWKTYSQEARSQLFPHLVVSIFFMIIALGPLLKIFNRWSFDAEGVPVYIPLPFLLIQHLPGFGSLRASSRFAIGAVFSGTIIFAYILDQLLQKSKKKYTILLVSLVSLLFLIDQSYFIAKRQSQYVPIRIYEYLNLQKDNGVVFEIPSTTRDGFQYAGFVHGISPMLGAVEHGHPIIGGYLARVQPYVFDYYKNIYFITYVYDSIDKGNYDVLLDTPSEVTVSPYSYDYDISLKQLQFLNVEYVLLKMDEEYSTAIATVLGRLGYIQKMKDKNVILFYHPFSTPSYSAVDLTNKNSRVVIGQQLSQGNIQSFILQTQTEPSTLQIKIHSQKNIHAVPIYINKTLLQTVDIRTGTHIYTFDIHNGKIGLQLIHLLFPKNISAQMLEFQYIQLK